MCKIQQGLRPSPAILLPHPWHAPAGTTLIGTSRAYTPHLLPRSHTLGMPLPVPPYPVLTPLACPYPIPFSHPWHAPAGTTLSRSHTLGMPLSVPPYPALLPSPRLHLGSWACLASTCGLGPPHHP